MNDPTTVDVALFVSILRKHGIEVSVSDVIQTLMESDDTYTTNDGETIRVFEKSTDDLFLEIGTLR